MILDEFGAPTEEFTETPGETILDENNGNLVVSMSVDIYDIDQGAPGPYLMTINPIMYTDLKYWNLLPHTESVVPT